MLNRFLVLSFLLFPFAAACGSDGSLTDTADLSLASEPIADIAASDGSLSTLAAALEAAGLVETLSGEGPFTVFAPTDDAFARLPDGALDALLADTDALRNVLLYHVVPGDLRARDVLAEAALTTVLGAPVTVQGEALTLNGTVNLVTTDIVAENGVIHLIDMVLLPPTDDDGHSDDDGEEDQDSDYENVDEDSYDDGSENDDDSDDAGADMDREDSDDEEGSDMDDDALSIVEIAAGEPQFSTLVTALQRAHLVETLQGEGPFTVFAPTNEAFAKLPEGVLDALLHDPDALAEILLYHVVPGDLRAADVVASSSLTTAQGAEIEVQGEQLTLNGDVNLVATDIVASNGVIHVIDRVLIPPSPEPTPSIVEIASSDDRFTLLVKALNVAHLVDALEGEGPFTVFAPTDEAFEALPKQVLASLLLHPSSLRNVLLYHVVPGDLGSDDVLASKALETLQGASIEIDHATLNGEVGLVETDIHASNGVIHVIDGVLIPPRH